MEELPLIACLKSSLPVWSTRTTRLPTVLTPFDDWALWKKATKPYNARLQGKTRPLALVYIESAEMISEAVKCAAKHRVPVVARSGGHDYAAHSLGGAYGSDTSHVSGWTSWRREDSAIDKPSDPEPTLVLDVRGLQYMHYYASTQHVVVGAGVLLGELNHFLEERGRALPTGACPTVGVAGQALSGGFGLMSRSLGLLLDTMISADVITATGESLHVSATEHPDLFWAMRGAGSSFAIAHRLTFATSAMPPSVTYFEFALLPRALPATHAAADRALAFFKLFEAFSDSKYAVRQLGMSWHMTPEKRNDGTYGTKVEVLGQYHGSREGFKRAETAFRKMAEDAKEEAIHYEIRQLSYLESLHNVGGSWDELAKRDQINLNEHVNFYAQSMITKEHIDSDAMRAHLQHLLNLSETYNPSTGVEWFVLAPFLGGQQSAVARFADDQTSAFAHRDMRMTWEFYAKDLEDPDQTSDNDVDLRKIVQGMTAPLGPIEAVYPAYVDPYLRRSEYPRKIWGSSYPRLQDLKARWDPSNLFRHPQSVRAKGSSDLLLIWLAIIFFAVLLLRGRLRRAPAPWRSPVKYI